MGIESKIVNFFTLLITVFAFRLFKVSAFPRYFYSA